MRKILTLLALAFCLSVASAGVHAVLIAGSNGFWNYRHQADICHAYQTLVKKGVPAENIITLAYDDVADDPSNPFPGQIFNKPNGKDVYKGCKIDYTGANVTVENFLGVLTANKTATNGQRVLNSTEEDHVFINFVDHGGTGIIAVVNSLLYADQLLGALQTMHKKKLYKQLVFYLEACESGSMFENLPKDINIYAATAANADESSWGCFCPPNDYINGTEIGSCLGDTFSVSWMENSDANNLDVESLELQFKEILPLVNQSHPEQFGDLTWINEPAGDFIGNHTANTLHRSLNGFPVLTGMEDARYAKLVSLSAQYKKDPSQEKLEAYLKELRSVEYFDNVFSAIDVIVGKSTESIQNKKISLPKDLSCLRGAVASFEEACGKLTDYSLKYIKTIAHLCYTYEVADLDALFTQVCSQDELTILRSF